MSYSECNNINTSKNIDVHNDNEFNTENPIFRSDCNTRLQLTRGKFKYLPLSVFRTRGGGIDIFDLVVKQTVTSSQQNTS